MRWIVYVSMLAAAMSLALPGTAQQECSTDRCRTVILCVPDHVAAQLVATGQFFYDPGVPCANEGDVAVVSVPHPPQP